MLFSCCMVGLSHDKAPSLTPSMQDNSLPCHRQLRCGTSRLPLFFLGDRSGPHEMRPLQLLRSGMPLQLRRGAPDRRYNYLSSRRHEMPPLQLPRSGLPLQLRRGAPGRRYNSGRHEMPPLQLRRGYHYGGAAVSTSSTSRCLSRPKGSWYHDILSGILLQPCELHQHPFFITSSSLRSIGI